MNLKTLTENDVKRFAPSEIFRRGVGYCHEGRVSNLGFDQDSETITAEVEGNYGDYTVEITIDEDGIDADCDCPYYGYPCKHMVAVLLSFVNGRSQYLAEVEKTKKQVSSLEGKIKQLPMKTLESKLEYGMDYWRLAEYWLEKGQSDKALEVVKEGIEKGTGRKNELYLYLQESYEENGDYESLAELLRSKIQRKELDYHRLANNELYKSLKRHYEATEDHTGQAVLLGLRLEDGELDFEFYQEAEWAIKDEDWQNFENRFIAKVKSQKDSKFLAEIYDYKGDMESLWGIIQNDRELLKKYEAKLSPLYPQEYIN